MGSPQLQTRLLLNGMNKADCSSDRAMRHKVTRNKLLLKEFAYNTETSHILANIGSWKSEYALVLLKKKARMFIVPTCDIRIKIKG